MARRWTVGAFAAALVQLAANDAAACGPEIEIRFLEASGGDIFIVSNNSKEPWTLLSLEIRLAGSFGRLVFDTADGGPGYSMYEPFAAVDNEVGLLGAPSVSDGAEEVRLFFRDFAPKRTFMFVIDVDDRLEISDFGQAVVSGAEIEGARARGVLTMTDGAKSEARGKFRDDGRAILRGGLCA